MSPFPSVYEEFIYKSRYARWREEDNRRENWDETVKRLVDYYWNEITLKRVTNDEFKGVYNDLYESIYNLEVMPSMRALMTAGPALDRRSEEHTSELQSLMRISYAVFCLKTKT